MSRAEAMPDRLLRGVASGDVETMRGAWRRLLALEAAAVPAVEARLDSDAWGRKPKAPAGGYLGVLLALLSELDAGRFADTIRRLSAGRLHPLHARTVKVLAGRMAERPVTRVGPGLPVFVADDLPDRAASATEIAGWNTVPGLALDQASRIDAIGSAPGMGWLGICSRFFSVMVLVWPGMDFGPGWLKLLGREHTFRREVGHPASGHIEGDRVIGREREAERQKRAPGEGRPFRMRGCGWVRPA